MSDAFVHALPNQILTPCTDVQIDLTVGAYKDGQGNATTLPSVRAAEKVVYEANEGHE